jgi:O-antigen ligase
MDWLEIFFNNKQKPEQRLGTILLLSTFVLLMFGPLAFGAVEPWSIFILQSGAAGLLVVWSVQQTLQNQILIRPNPLFAPMLAFGALILAQLLLRRSAYTHETVNCALLYAAYGILCFLVSQAMVRREHVQLLAVAFSIYGLVVACFAVLQGVASNGQIYWVRPLSNGGWIYGPYVNHNHYAGLMEMLVPIPLVISLSKLADQKQRAAAAVAAAVMAGTIFLSGSRGGMVAVLVEFAILAVLLAKQEKGMRTAVTAAIFSLVVVGVLVWLGGAELSRRIATVSSASHSDITNSMRMSLNRDGIRMFLLRPVLGWGLGTFPIAYPQFRSFYTNFFVNEAHDDYVQLLVEMGLLGFATMIWYLVCVFRAGIGKLANWTTDINGALAASCLLGISGILVHSLVDFNLQIPANAALFYVLCTLAASAKLVQPVRRRKPVKPTQEHPLPASEVV